MSRSSASRLRQAGRIGGLTKAALYDSRDGTAKARDAFWNSFLEGHGCKVCAKIDIPSDLPSPERHRRADALRRRHFSSIALHRLRRGPIDPPHKHLRGSDGLGGDELSG